MMYDATFLQGYQFIWSKTHGPSLVNAAEEHAAREELARWRMQMMKKSSQKHNDTPILEAIKSSQNAFNGYGAQETCDMLAVHAFIWPGMPARLVCKDEQLWSHLLEATFAYQRDRMKTLEEGNFPSVSGSRPFHTYVDAHERFLAGVPCCKRSFVPVTTDQLNMYHSLSLLDHRCTIRNQGNGEGKSLSKCICTVCLTHHQCGGRPRHRSSIPLCRHTCKTSSCSSLVQLLSCAFG